jgi:hypothetical protein
LKKELSAKQDEEYRIKKELDFQTRAFVSPYASQIAFLATKRAEVKIDVDKYNEYLKIFQKFDQVQKKVNELEMRKEDLQQQLEAAMGKEETVKSRIDYLNEQYNNTLEGFRPPLFGEQKNSIIDRRTYLPEYHGRRFDEISSPGLATLVSVAYLIAHQKTSIHFNLGLPNILLIDGLSEHLGKEGFDPERQEAVYQYLIQMSEELGDILQIIIVDNEVPAIARKFIRLELSESERLITI